MAAILARLRFGPKVRCLALLKQCPGGAPQQLPPGAKNGNRRPSISVRRAVFAEMNHSDAIIAVVFLLASVIWLIRLSDTDRKR
jgi:hypothetical protein